MIKGARQPKAFPSINPIGTPSTREALTPDKNNSDRPCTVLFSYNIWHHR